MNDMISTLRSWAEKWTDSPALLAPGREPLTFAGLLAQSERTAGWLREGGIGPRDRVALALPNGPDSASAFIGVAAACGCAPLNPAYRAAEIEFYLEDLSARALIVQEGHPVEARLTAERMGLPVWDLRPGAAAGAFDLLPSAQAPTAPEGHPGREEVALLLHTSGTTSRPKLVPLTQANLLVSAGNIGRTLGLGRGDRCLNVMPLFHIHGLAACLLASLAAGASVVCTPGFYAPEIVDWMRTFRPTWISAVPTMLQALLERVESGSDPKGDPALRFIRSSSSPLAPQLMQALEARFGCPVIEAYGMTEAAHQMASNPLPPALRKAGSVGPAAGPEMAIMAEQSGDLLPDGETGEIVIRGPNVTPGYEASPQANREAFHDGWFRTGDLGYRDEDGYFTITGRRKEIINRGGEKISPREIDEILLDHPAVAQAVTFSLPDPRLGEEVAAAVVLRDPGASIQELQAHVAGRAIEFKVPRRIVVLDALPKGPTGKPVRVGLARRLGLEAAAQEQSPAPLAPRDDWERTIAAMWCEVLGLEEVGVNQAFLEVGGYSLLAARLLNRIRTEFGVRVTMVDFFDAPTIADQAGLVRTFKGAAGEGGAG